MVITELFGSNMSAVLPTQVKDVSDVRQIPDNQEVFVHPQTDQSLIVEVLEYVKQPDNVALEVHFNDLADTNDAPGENATIILKEPIPTTERAMEQCSSAYYLYGEQMVAKFKESARNKISVHMGLFRLPEKQTDFLITFNDPMNIHLESSSSVPVPVSAQPWTVQDFKSVLATVKINDISFLG